MGWIGLNRAEMGWMEWIDELDELVKLDEIVELEDDHYFVTELVTHV